MNGFIYHGRILKPDSTPLVSSSVRFEIRLYGKESFPVAKRCLLYSEEHNNVSMTNSQGVFELKVGTGTTLFAPPEIAGVGMSRIFLNSPTFMLTGLSCTAGTSDFTAETLDADREIEVTVQFDSTTLNLPAQKMMAAPWAMQAMEIGGYSVDYLAKVNTPLPYQLQATSLMFVSNNFVMNNGGTPTFYGDDTARITNLQNPTSPQDAATKAYVDSAVGSGFTAGNGIDISSGTIKIAQMSATSGQVIKWNGTTWAPAADTGGLTSVSYSDLNSAGGTVNEGLIVKDSAGRLFNQQCSANQVLAWSVANGWDCTNPSALVGVGQTTISGGTQNYLAKFNAAGNNVVDSAVFENGGNVGIGSASPGAKLHVSGTVLAEGHSAMGNGGGIDATTLPEFSATWASPTRGFASNLVVAEKSTTPPAGTNPYVNGIASFLVADPSASMASGKVYGIDAYVKSASGNTQSIGTMAGLVSNVEHNSNGPTNFLYGAGINATKIGGSGVVSNLRGLSVNAAVSSDVAATVANVSGIESLVYTNNFFGGPTNIGTAYGLKTGVRNWGTAITTSYGLYIDQVDGTTNYGLYQVTASNRNYFAGKVGIGVTNADTKLHIVGTLKVADGGETCTVAGNGGMIRYSGTSLQFCNGTSWQTVGTSTGDVTDVTASAPLSVTNSTGPNPNVSLANGSATGDILQWNGSAWANSTVATCTAGQYLSFNGTTWACSAPAGTTYTAGDGLSLTANDFDINVDNTTIEVNSDTLRVKDGAISYAKLNSAGGTINEGLIVKDSSGRLFNQQCSANQVLTWSVANGWECTNPSALVGVGQTTISGGTQNYLAKFNAAGTNVVNSAIFESGGNVGIGTASPAAALSLGANSNTLITDGTDAVSSSGVNIYPSNQLNKYAVGIFNPRSGASVGHGLLVKAGLQASSTYILRTQSEDSVEALAVLSSGRVGINNVSPAAALSLGANSNTILSDGTDSVGVGGVNIVPANQNTKYVMGIKNPRSGASAGHGLLIQAGWPAYANYVLRAQDGEGADIFAVKSNGHVGVATTSPFSALSVGAGSNAAVGDGATSVSNLGFNLSIMDHGGYAAGINNSGSVGGGLIIKAGGASQPSLRVQKYNGTTALSVFNDKVRIGSSNTVPDALLHVGDNASITGGPAYNPYLSVSMFDHNSYAAGFYNSASIGGGMFVRGGGTSTPTFYASDYAGGNPVVIKSGSLAIGTTSPSARLHLPAGTTAASTAPLKFEPTSAALMSATENGAMEFDGTDYYLTAGGTRKKIMTGTASSGISGSGTTNYIPKFTAAGAVGNSVIYDDGTNVGIGTTTPNGLLNVKSVAASAFTVSSDVATNGNVVSSVVFRRDAASVSHENIARIDAYQNGASGTNAGGEIRLMVKRDGATQTDGLTITPRGGGKFDGTIAAGGASVDSQRGINAIGNVNSSAQVYGGHFSATNTGTGGVTGIYSKRTHSNAGTATNAYGVYVDTLSVSSGAVTNNYGLYVDQGTAGTNNYGAYIAGSVGIGMTPSYKLDVNGDVNIDAASSLRFGGTQVCTSAGCTTPSDRRLKENIQPLQDALSKILTIQGVEYDYIDKGRYSDRHQIGVIAQNVEQVYPEAVLTDSKTGFKSVAYDHLIAPLLQAFKEIYARVLGIESKLEVLQEENRRLEKENSDLKRRLERIEQLVLPK